MSEKEDLEKDKLSLEIKELQRPYYLRHQFLAIFAPIMAALIALSGIMLSNYYDSEKVKLSEKIEELTSEKSSIKLELDKLNQREVMITEYVDATKQMISEYQKAKSSFEVAIETELTPLYQSIKESEKEAESIYKESLQFKDDASLSLEAALSAANYFGQLANTQGIYIDHSKKFDDEILSIFLSQTKELDKKYKTEISKLK